MKYYDHLIKNTDADSIALLYTPDGNLGNVAIGRDSIKKFLQSFKDIKVISQYSTTETIKIRGDTAWQIGKYHQVARLSSKDTVNVKGVYSATWQWIPDGGWHIKKMITKPLL